MKLAFPHRLVAQVVDDAAEQDLLADERRDVPLGAARTVDPRVHDVLRGGRQSGTAYAYNL